MKKKLLTLALAAMLSAATLFGGCGFSGSDAKQIENITALHNAEKGVTQITITYADDLYDPTFFEIPDGKQGDIGYTGNGVESIVPQDEADGSRSMLITLTDGSKITLPIVDGVDGEDGEDGKGIDKIQSIANIDGSVSIKVLFTDGSESNEIPVPGGKDGDKVTISTEVQTDESIKVVFTVTDHWGNKVPYDLTIPKGEKGNSVEYIIGSLSEDKTQYILKIKIENVDGLQEVSFSRPNSLLVGSKKPLDDEGDTKGDGINGDMYYNTANQIFYVKDNGVWSETLDLSNNERYTVKFEASAWIENEQISIDVDPQNLFSGLKQGTFYSNYFAVRLPVAVLPASLQASYEFVGWYTTANPNFTTQAAFTDLTFIASDMTLYPVFVAK